MSAETVFDRFKEERQRLGMTHAEIGEACGASRRTVIDWEKGSKIPAEALAQIVAAGVDIDVQYVITGVRWGRLGPQDPELAAMSGTERAKAALDRALVVQKRLGIKFTKEQLQALMGYAFGHCPTLDSLEAFARAAYTAAGQPLAEPKSADANAGTNRRVRKPRPRGMG